MVVVFGVWYSLVSPDAGDIAEDTTNRPQKEENNSPDQELSGISLSLYNNDKSVKFNLNANNVKQYENQSLLKLYPVKIKAYDIQGEEELLYTFQAKSGKYHSTQGMLDLQGPVSIKRDKINLDFADLTWQKNKNRITGEKVKFSSPNYSLTGARFESNTKLTRFVFYGSKENKARFIWKENIDDTD